MKKVLFFSILLFLFSQSFLKAQSSTDTIVYIFVEQTASFPGGDEARMKFISENTNYPSAAKENGIEGTVYVEFIVEKDGSLSNIKVIKSVYQPLDEETVRVIRLMPKWTPAMQAGKPVRQKVIVPIIFKLDSGRKKK